MGDFMSIGLALSGGGVKGSAHIGALKALEEEKVKIDYVGGTSSGSIVATLYAAGYKPEEIYNIFKKYCKNIKYVEMKNIFKLFFGIIFKGTIIIDGLNSGKSINKLINKLYILYHLLYITILLDFVCIFVSRI